MRHWALWGSLIAIGLLSPVQAEEAAGHYFSHEDWELACDNTGTCRAAGYQPGGHTPAISVLLTREAGPGTPVTGELHIGALDEDGVDAVNRYGQVMLRIDSERLGAAAIDASTYRTDLSERDVEALLKALRRDSHIEWVAGDVHWHLSGIGAAAVLLRMDDVQGRIGTPGAIMRSGSRSESEVPSAQPLPVITTPAVPDDDQPLTAVQLKDIREELLSTMPENDECLGLDDYQGGDTELTATRLSERKILVSTRCWLAAYNMGVGYWVINDAPPYDPGLVTMSGSDYGAGRIFAAHKGRGIGDCWSGDEWVWDGERFIHTRSHTTGKCRLVDGGGAWILPTLVTEVIRKDANADQ